jgi:hypothetical protein
MQIVWAIIVGAVAGFIARWISPSPHNPQGFVRWRHFSAVRFTCMALIKVQVSSHPSSVPSLYCGDGIKWRRIAEHRPVGRAGDHLLYQRPQLLLAEAWPDDRQRTRLASPVTYRWQCGE